MLSTVATSFCGQSTAPGASSTDAEIVSSGGIARSYSVYMPAAANSHAPAVIFFHGAGGTADDMRHAFPSTLADRYGFVAVYPESAPDTRQTWALGCYQCTWADVAGVNDYEFAKVLVDSLVSRHSVDRGRVYGVGFSLGGSFVFDLACRTALVAGMASVSSMPSPDELRGCAPPTPVDALMMMGDRDPNVPWTGGGQYDYLAADSAAHLWARWDGCTDQGTPTILPDANNDQMRVRVLEFSSCSQNKAVRLYRIEGAGHTWPSGDLDGADEILGFFFRRSS